MSALLVGCAVTANAQMVAGTIVGTVTDQAGAVVIGATVTIRNIETNQTRIVTTEARGNYVAPNLPLGSYEVVAESPGFARAARSNIPLDADQRVRADFVLQVGELTETVQVDSAAPILRTEVAELGQVIGQRAVDELPLNGRNFVQLVTLAPGVGFGIPGQSLHGNSPSAFRGDTAVSVNAGRADQNNFMLDGVDNNEADVNTIVIIPIIDGIEEFKVLTNNFSAEYGRATGAVVSVQTKSGTNQPRGTLFEFHRNSALDARNYFDPPGDPPTFIQNQFGGSIGGPLRENRTFFFADYQGTRIRKAETFVGTVPTERMRRGDFSEVPALPGNVLRNPFGGVFPDKVIPSSAQDPAAAALLQLYPLPNRPGLVNNFVNNPVMQRQDHQFDVRVDHRFSDRSNVFVRYSFGDVTRFQPSHLTDTGAPAGGDIFTGVVGRLAGAGNATLRTQGAAANHTFVITPRLLNEFRFGWTRFALHNEPEGFGENLADQFRIPGLNVSPLTSSLPRLQVVGFIGHGPAAFLPDFSTQNMFQFIDNVSWISGRHTFKTGVDYRRRHRDNYEAFNQQGVFIFTPTFTGFGLADFLTGYPTTTLRTLLNGSYRKRSWEFAAYAQDDVVLTPKLKLNLGVRYELWAPAWEAGDHWSNWDPVTGNMITPESPDAPGRALRRMDKNNIGPRLGIAYTPTDKTALSAGYSINYLEDGGQVVTMTLADNFPFAVTQFLSASTAPVNRLSDGLPVPTVPASSLRPSGNIKGIDINFRTPVTDMWMLSAQREIRQDTVLELAYTGSRSRNLRAGRNVNQPVPGPASVPFQVRRPYFAINPGLANVAVSQSVGESDYHGLQLRLNKRLGSSLGFLASYTWSKAVSTDEGALGLCADGGPQDSRNPEADRSVSCTDIPHRLVVSYTYALPFGRDLSGFAKLLASGWQVNGITLLRSGLPFTPTYTTTSAVTGTTVRPDRLCSGELPAAQRSIERWFDTNCFTVPAVFGNSGRNILRGPGAVNFDLSVFKNLDVNDRSRLQFRAEVFNLFNTPQFQLPVRQLDSPEFGTIRETVNASRQVQLSLKLYF